MGTRCLTVLKDNDGKEIAALYRQFDGYPEGHGAELENFCQGFKIVNGFRSEHSEGKFANTMADFAAQLITHFKNSQVTEDQKNQIGGFYLYPAGTRDRGEDYVYTVSLEEDQVKITCDEA